MIRRLLARICRREGHRYDWPAFGTRQQFRRCGRCHQITRDDWR